MTGPDRSVVCFHCGGAVEEGGAPLLNVLEEGEPCPACAERLMAELPPIFHTPWQEGGVPERSTRTESEAGGYEPDGAA